MQGYGNCRADWAITALSACRLSPLILSTILYPKFGVEGCCRFDVQSSFSLSSLPYLKFGVKGYCHLGVQTPFLPSLLNARG